MPSMSKIDKVKSRGMVGTLRAASENDKQNGRCTPCPYIPEREQIRQSQNGKRKTASKREQKHAVSQQRKEHENRLMI